MMRLIIAIGLIMGGLFGMVVSLLGNTVVSSGLYALDGLEISVALGAFSILALLSGIYNIFTG